MIKENDIRIGNAFQHNANWCYRSPSEIKPFIFQWTSRDWYECIRLNLCLEDIEPIDLTHVNLLKCGFTLGDGYYWKTWGTNGVFIVKFDTVYNKFFVEAGKGFNLLVEYIHELQNAFYVFSLGRELEITL